MKSKFISVVIAVYNEEENVKELNDRIFNSMNFLGLPFEVIYVIDGKDRSFDVLDREKKQGKSIILDYSEKPRGFRNAFVKGFGLVNTESSHILTMDADLNHRPEEISRLIDKMESSKADFVIGSRYAGGSAVTSGLPKRMISIFANIVIKVLWGINIKDKTSGFRLYKKEVIDKIVPLCKSSNFEFLFEILMLANRSRMRIEEVPINFDARLKGESKFDLFKVTKGYLKLIGR